MLSHDRIWNLIDRLAARNGLSVSGLAKRAGLDPTTFNKSKRVANDGRLRWPSTESLAKILQATNTNVVDFYLGLGLEQKGAAARRLELKPWADVFAPAKPGFADGDPDDEAQGVWFPAGPERTVYAVDVPDSAVGPAYRANCRLVVSPDAPIAPGDRVLALGTDGGARVLQVHRLTETAVEVTGLDGSGAETLPISGLAFLAKVLWASQ